MSSFLGQCQNKILWAKMDDNAKADVSENHQVEKLLKECDEIFTKALNSHDNVQALMFMLLEEISSDED